jgi:hypothetical protein
MKEDTEIIKYNRRVGENDRHERRDVIVEGEKASFLEDSYA